MPAGQEVGYGPYEGKHLNIRVEPEEEKGFYFTDEKPIFSLHVENIGSEEFDDDLQWFIGFPGGRETTGLCSVYLKLGEKRKYTAGARLLGFPGTAALCLRIPSKLPVRGAGIDLVTPYFHTLYTFEVYDRALYERAQREKRKTLRLLIASLAVAGITLMAVIASIIISIDR